MLRDSPVVVERSQAIDAPPEQVWSLLSSPAAWSLRPYTFAFDTAGPAETRLRVSLGINSQGRPYCLLHEVRDEVPGQVIRLHMLGILPPSRQVLTLSAAPDGHGARATIAVTQSVARGGLKTAARAYWRREAEVWLGNLRAVIEGRAPWPAAPMPPGLQVACSPRALLRAPAEASASALISAPISQVWKVIHAPESARLADPEHVVCAGQVPGTPQCQAGEMQYFVMRLDDGRLWPTVLVVTELTDQHSALAARLTPPHDEVLHLLTTAAGGTRLELTYRWPASIGKKNPQAWKRRMADRVQAQVASYKKLIEDPDQRLR
jgi:uncharacterized protein YndB with AHSA1/START domain